jgi:hypothetical protein
MVRAQVEEPLSEAPPFAVIFYFLKQLCVSLSMKAQRDKTNAGK